MICGTAVLRSTTDLDRSVVSFSEHVTDGDVVMMSPRPAAVWLALGSLSTLAIIKAYEKYQNTEKGSKAVTTPTKTTSVASASVVAAGVAAAVKVMSLACCKHSKYNVGACLTALDDNKEGEIRYYTGVNVESDVSMLEIRSNSFLSRRHSLCGFSFQPTDLRPDVLWRKGCIVQSPQRG